MKFRYLVDRQPTTENNETLTRELRAGHSYGAVTLSQNNLFIRRGTRTYYIPYSDAQKIFRRVRSLHANICCGDGDIEVDYLVVMADDREIAEISLPGRKAAKMLMEELKTISPETDFAAPPRAAEPIEA
ncbi:MAG: hypothetical protein IJ058_01420 [Lachnospiraceae bacterium]|nr:hypothetical protein [Lachnospiraceae bacterium]